MMRLIALLGMGFSLSYRWAEVWRFMDSLYLSPLPIPAQCGGRRAVYALQLGAMIYRIMKEEYGSTVRHFAALQRVYRKDRWLSAGPHMKYLRTLKCGSTRSLPYRNKRGALRIHATLLETDIDIVRTVNIVVSRD